MRRSFPFKGLLLGIVAILLFTQCRQESKEFGSEDLNGFTGSIHGSVQSRKEEVLSGVVVVLSPGGATTVSGPDGYFEFGDLRPGHYLLHYLKTDYRDTALSDSVATAGIAVEFQDVSGMAVGGSFTLKRIEPGKVRLYAAISGEGYGRRQSGCRFRV